MFERQREREKKKKRNFPLADLFPNACAGWGLAETRSLELCLSPLCGRKGASDPRQHPGPPRCTVSGSCSQELRWGWHPGTVVWEAGFPNVNHAPNAHPLTSVVEKVTVLLIKMLTFQKQNVIVFFPLCGICWISCHVLMVLALNTYRSRRMLRLCVDYTARTLWTLRSSGYSVPADCCLAIM